ncbi:hypothetical protein [Glutamicibacter soli]
MARGANQANQSNNQGPVLRLPPEHRSKAKVYTGLAASGGLVSSICYLTDQMLPMGAAMTLTGVSIAGTAWMHRRTVRKLEERDRLVEILAPVALGFLDRRRVELKKWTMSNGDFWPGKVVIKFHDDLLGEDCAAAVIDQLQQRYQRQYAVKKITNHQRLMVLTEAGELLVEEPEDVHPMIRRTSKVVKKLFSAGNAEPPVATVELEDDEPVKVEIQHDIGSAVTNRMVQNDKAFKFGAMLPGRWKAEWDNINDRVTFTLRPALPTFVPHPPIPPMEGTAIDNYKTPYCYGVDETGEAVAWRPWLDPMMLITGLTGRGKTVVAHSVLTELAARGWIIDVADAKLVEFLGYKNWPNVRIVAPDLEQQVRLVYVAKDLMAERYNAIKNGEASEEDFVPYVLFLDEFALFREDVDDWYQDIKQKGDPSKAPMHRKVAAILRAGRTARVHIVLLTQRPDAEILGSGEARLNLSCRVSMGPLDMDGARMMWKSPSLGTTVPSNIRGRGTTRNEAGEVVEFQAYWTPDPRRAKSDEDLAILKSIYPAKELHPKMMIKVPAATYEDESELLPSYSQYISADFIPVPGGVQNQDEDSTERDESEEYEEPRIVEISSRPMKDHSRSSAPSEAKAKIESNVLTFPSPTTAEDEPEETIEFDEQDESKWGEIETIGIEDTEVGSLMELDGEWAAVTSSEEDLADEEAWAVCLVFSDGSDTMLSMEIGSTVTVRQPAYQGN